MNTIVGGHTYPVLLQSDKSEKECALIILVFRVCVCMCVFVISEFSGTGTS